MLQGHSLGGRGEVSRQVCHCEIRNRALTVTYLRLKTDSSVLLSRSSAILPWWRFLKEQSFSSNRGQESVFVFDLSLGNPGLDLPRSEGREFPLIQFN